MVEYSPNNPQPPPLPDNAESCVWGFWWTVVFGSATFLFHLTVVLVFGVAAVALFRLPPSELKNSGDLFALAAFFGGISWLVCIVPAALKKGSKLRDYFSLRVPRIVHAALWTVALLAFVVASDGLRTLSGYPIVPTHTMLCWNSCRDGLFPLLLLGAIVCAPLGEEFIFRGFLLKGFGQGFGGYAVASLLTSGAWAIIHMQYGWFNQAALFVMGLVLCAARLHSKSLWTPVWLHMLNNTIAIVQVAYHAQQRGI